MTYRTPDEMIVAQHAEIHAAIERLQEIADRMPAPETGITWATTARFAHVIDALRRAEVATLQIV